MISVRPAHATADASGLKTSEGLHLPIRYARKQMELYGSSSISMCFDLSVFLVRRIV